MSAEPQIIINQESKFQLDTEGHLDVILMPKFDSNMICS